MHKSILYANEGMLMLISEVEDKHELVKMLNRNKRLDKPEACSEGCFEIMDKCWRFEPSRRPTFSEIKRSVAEL